VLVVLGAWVGRVDGADVVVNDAWPEGMGSSLRAGLTALEDSAEDIDAVLVTLVDLPGMTGEAVRRLVECDADLAMACYEGEPGHPVRLAREVWPDVMATAKGDQGARQLLRSRDDVVHVEVGDIASGEDLDTPR
jgi:CTP:molybdopterin cytidylyltransferase MocA